MGNNCLVRCKRAFWGCVKISFVLFFLTVVIFSYEATAEQKIAEKELIDMIQVLEKNINVLEYKMNYKISVVQTDVVDFSKSIFKFSNLANTTSIEKKTHFLTEPGTGRIYFKREGTTRISDAGSSNFYFGKFEREIGFDGKIRSQLNKSKDYQRTGIISKEPLKINQELSSFEMGMDMLLPCYNGVGLSNFLVSDKVDKSSVQAALQDDGAIEIVFRKKSNMQKFRLIVDIEKDGAILSEEYFGTRSEDTVVVKMEYMWQKNDKGFWVPLKGIGVSGTHNPRVHLWDFEEVQINHSNLTSDNYRVTFPNGTKVEDRVVGINYTVGYLPGDVRREVNKTLMESFKMNPSLSKDLDNQVAPERTSFSPAAKEKERSLSDNTGSLAINDSDLTANSRALTITIFVFVSSGVLILVYILFSFKKS